VTGVSPLRLIRVFFRGRFRRPDWLIWVGLLLAGLLAGLSGTFLPDDMLSGGSLSVLTGVIFCCRPSPPIQRTGPASVPPGSRCTGCCGRRPRTTRSRTTSSSRCTR